MRCASLVLLACAGFAADPPPPPDPYGLGERLALIDHLRESYGRKLAPGLTIEQLRAAYAEAWAARQAAAAPADSGLADRERRLRQRILDRHGVEAEAALDESGLQDLLRRLDAALAVRNAALIDGLMAADRAAPRAPTDAPVETPEAAPEAAPAKAKPVAEAPPAAPEQALRRIVFPARGVSDCLLATFGERRLLLVTFGIDHNGAFTGIREGAFAIVERSPAINRSVLLLGHGAGNAIADESIARHLAANRAFYESMGGTAEPARIDALVFAACAGGGQSQMTEMRDGLGYWPTWRVASGDNAKTTGLNVLAAFAAVASRPATPAWRGLFRLRQDGAEIVSFGDVGIAGERAETSFYRIVQDASGRWQVEEQR